MVCANLLETPAALIDDIPKINGLDLFHNSKELEELDELEELEDLTKVLLLSDELEDLAKVLLLSDELEDFKKVLLLSDELEEDIFYLL